MTTSRRSKIALIGSGNIGGTLAHLALQRRIGDVVMIDVAEGIPQGKGLDLSQGSAIDGIEGGCLGSNNAADMAGADVVIVTAGVPRKPGMSRDDLLSINASIVRTVAGNIKTYCPGAFVIVVTNPLDVMAGVLDSGRYKHFLATELNVSPADIQAFVLGGHGDAMVPMPRYTSIGGVPLSEWLRNGALSQERLDSIIDRTKNGGAEIVNYLKTGSAFYAPASAALTMAESYLFDERRILPCATYLNGEYGHTDIYAGVPVIIGKNGVEKVIELPLEENEKNQFDASVQSVQKLIEDITRLGL